LQAAKTPAKTTTTTTATDDATELNKLATIGSKAVLESGVDNAALTLAVLTWRAFASIDPSALYVLLLLLLLLLLLSSLRDLNLIVFHSIDSRRYWSI
jgi:hypothetical protein